MGDIKEDWGSRGRKSPSGVQGWSPGRQFGDKVPQKLKLFCETTHNICIKNVKCNKQQLLLLLDKITLAAKYTLKTYFSLSTFQALKYNKYVIHFPWGMRIWT